MGILSSIRLAFHRHQLPPVAHHPSPAVGSHAKNVDRFGLDPRLDPSWSRHLMRLPSRGIVVRNELSLSTLQDEGGIEL